MHVLVFGNSRVCS